MVELDVAFIREAMEEKGITNTQLSEALGFSRDYVSDSFRKGKMNPDRLQQVYDYLGLGEIEWEYDLSDVSTAQLKAELKKRK